MFILPLLVLDCGQNKDKGPTVDSMAITLNEDTPVTVSLTASDPENDPLTWIIVENAYHGSITGTLPQITYTPSPDYYGSDYFTFKVSDGYTDSDIATLNITIYPVNDPPTETGASIATHEDTVSAGVTPWVMDADITDTFTYFILTQPAGGTALIDSNRLVYDPGPNFNGSDSFTFRTSDSAGKYVDGTATVTVIPVNDPPTSTLANIVTLENTTSLGVTPTVSDLDSGDTFTFSILTQPSSGTAFVQSNQLFYQPNLNFRGSDSFTYRAFDSGNASVDGTATVLVTREGENVTPVADNQSIIAQEDMAEPIVLTGSDFDGDELTYSIVSAPSNGALTGTPPNVSYLSALNFNGPDSFTFQVNDGISDSNIATVTITITPVNDPPTETSAAVITDEDTASAGVTPSVVDVDTVDSYFYSVLTQPANGSALVSSNQLVYEPAPDFNGNDSFNYRATHSGGEYVDGLATVTVNPTNDPPTETSASITTDEDTLSAGVTPTVVDIDNGDSFTFTILTQPSSGTAFATATQIFYQPAPDISGSDSFTYRAFDSGLERVDGVATVTIVPVNDAPVADGQAVTTAEDAGIAIILTGSDVEGDALTFSIVSDPTHGTLTGTPPNVTYLPEPNYSGFDVFTFKTNDGSLDSVPGTVQITVGSRPDIWFVDGDAAGNADGRSWGNAFNHPQDALDITGPGDEIWVAEGIYGPLAGRNFVITMTGEAPLYGGFNGTETSLSERDFNTYLTVLDGEDTVNVVSGAENARLDGFTVTGGRLSGMVNTGVSPTVINCVFENNGLVEGQDGGAIQNIQNANALILNTTFSNNYRSAIYNADSSPTIDHCTFLDNQSDTGGAIKNTGQTTQPYIGNSLFDSNTASLGGGAISNSSSDPLIESCTFSNNIAGENGGAVYSSGGAAPNIINSIFTGNAATAMGGAVYSFESLPVIINDTFYGNTAAQHGGIATEKGHGKGATIMNSIVWGNTNEQVYDGPSSKSVVSNSDIQGGYTGTGNLNQDPAFVDPASGDLHLSAGSPSIDTGDNAAATSITDLDGNPRITDGNGDGTATVDMGAYEYVP